MRNTYAIGVVVVALVACGTSDGMDVMGGLLSDAGEMMSDAGSAMQGAGDAQAAVPGPEAGTPVRDSSVAPARDSAVPSTDSGGPPLADHIPNPRLVLWDKDGEPVEAMPRGSAVLLPPGSDVSSIECAGIDWIGTKTGGSYSLSTGASGCAGDAPGDDLPNPPYTLTVEY